MSRTIIRKEISNEGGRGLLWRTTVLYTYFTHEAPLLSFSFEKEIIEEEMEKYYDGLEEKSEGRKGTLL